LFLVHGCAEFLAAVRGEWLAVFALRDDANNQAMLATQAIRTTQAIVILSEAKDLLFIFVG